jgi:hypothetical protein
MKLRASRWVHLFNLLESLNLGECVTDIEQVMKDSCHLLPRPATECWRRTVTRYWVDKRTSKRAAEMTDTRAKQSRTHKAARRSAGAGHSRW